ncbi:hypothetical protein Lesp02_13550 [Lentzea sp. NBRC 105346]|uniref:DUF6766 family protein n=1 Tax=Lentzea sp. NBRC 105346 TaxID=3032205 RepID=UPI00249F96A7|nr:DUF6766 family protein [Lentzea sp. NBRC 105346]GLZ29165.1 hypothetical protein Lesp02_13550 [Lentzea sp. NBRC 105346]
MKKFLRENSLTLAFGLLFLGALVGQFFVGHADFNERQLTAGLNEVSLGEYLVSSDFWVDVTENWQSEYLQFFLYVTATVWLIQRGSPESKPPDKAGPQPDKEQQVGQYASDSSPRWARVGGWRTRLYSNSLGLVMLLLFLFSWSMQSITGWYSYNSQQLQDFMSPVGWLSYVGSPDFWNRSLQNWQSEFLAIASMAILSVWFRQHSSPESKPVGAAHSVSDRSG